PGSSRGRSSRKRWPLSTEPEWLAPESLEQALALKAERAGEVTIVAGGTFVGLLVNQRLLSPEAFLSLQRVPGLDYVRANGDLRLGARSTDRKAAGARGRRRGGGGAARPCGATGTPPAGPRLLGAVRRRAPGSRGGGGGGRGGR